MKKDNTEKVMVRIDSKTVIFVKPENVKGARERFIEKTNYKSYDNKVINKDDISYNSHHII